MDSENLQQQLIDRINTHLDLCDAKDTPIICNMLQEKETRQQVVDLAVRKVIMEKMDIPQAIISINNEFDPNYVD